MANKDVVSGCRPFGAVLRMTPYVAKAAIYPGDPVKQDADGNLVVGTAGAALRGVAATYAAAGEEVLVFDHPDQLFVCQSDDSSIDALTDFNLNYQFVFGSADTLYRRSGAEIDGSTGATNSNYQAKVLRMERSIDNALGANVKVILKINNHELGSGTGTVGV